MNKWTLKSLAAAAVGVLTLAGQANAAVSYSYVTDAPGYTLNPGQTQTVKLYLLETLGAGDSSNIVADAGLAGAAMRVRRDAAAPAGAPTLGALTYNTTDFSGPSNPPTGGVQTPTEIAFQETGPLAGASPIPGNNGGNAANAKASAVFLGSVDVLAGSAAGQFTFNLLRYDPTTTNGSGDTITSGHAAVGFADSHDLDKLSNASPSYAGTAAFPTSFTVNVVPEPTSIGVITVLGAAGSLIRRRRQA
jgi:hypothetical protein